MKGNPQGVYLFYGEEEYLKRRYLEQLRQAIVGDDPAAAFNHVKIEGGDLAKFSAELDGLPMLTGFADPLSSSRGRLVELWDTDFTKMKSDTLHALCDLLTEVEDTTVVIYTLPDEFPAGTAKKPSATLSALSKCTQCVNFEKQKPQVLAGWVARHAKACGCLISPDLCRMLINYCSPDMYSLVGEVEKLCAYVRAKGRTIAEEGDIYAVCSPLTVYGAFDFANALLDRNTSKAFVLLEDMKARKERPENILGTVSKLCSELLQIRVLRDAGLTPAEIGAKLKISDYPLSLRLKNAMSRPVETLERACALCQEADRKIKSTRLDSFRAIELLILEMI